MTPWAGRARGRCVLMMLLLPLVLLTAACVGNGAGDSAGVTSPAADTGSHGVDADGDFQTTRWGSEITSNQAGFSLRPFTSGHRAFRGALSTGASRGLRHGTGDGWQQAAVDSGLGDPGKGCGQDSVGQVRLCASESQSRSMWWDSDRSAVCGICFASNAIRARFVEMVPGVCGPAIVPSCGSVFPRIGFAPSDGPSGALLVRRPGPGLRWTSGPDQVAHRRRLPQSGQRRLPL